MSREIWATREPRRNGCSILPLPEKSGCHEPARDYPCVLQMAAARDPTHETISVCRAIEEYKRATDWEFVGL